MTRRHCNENRFNINIFAVYRSTNTITEDKSERIQVIIILSCQDAVLPTRRYTEQALHMLLILVVGLDVPEGYGGILAVHLGEGVDHGVGEEGPLVVGADVGEVNEGIYRQGDS